MARRRVYEEIAALFDYNPPPTTLSAESNIAFTYPNVFYDRHLDLRLSLRHIKAAPPLSFELSELVHEKLKVLKSRNQPLPFLSNDECRFITENGRKSFPPSTTIWDAESVARFYSCASYENCAPVASTIALYPHGEAWGKILDFYEGSELERDRRPAMIDNYTLRVSHHHETGELDIPNAVLSYLSDELRQDIRTMSDKFRTLAVFQFHVPSTEAEDLFRDMGAIAKRSKIPPFQCPSAGFTASQDISPLAFPDSPEVINSLPCITAHCTSTRTVRRSARLSSRSGRSESVSTRGLKGRTDRTRIKIWPTLNVKPTKTSRPDSFLFIQHAWTRAVQSDATLIIFNCGNYERIGFRHRDSQTLFLSDLINVSESFDPGYGQIQIGLYMAILRDALDRTRQIKLALKAEGATTRAKRKRSNDAECIDANYESKRPRTRLMSLREQRPKGPPEDVQEIVLRETSRRDLVLLWFKYGPFNSPEPAILHRIGRSPDDRPSPKATKERKYSPEDYVCLTLTSEIAEGATGKVHDAKIEVQASNNRVYSCEVVVKIALGDRERQKLRHEYAVYRFMILKNVSGVATVYGLWEDAANEATVFAMGHVGTSLVKQPHYRAHRKVSLTEEQKEAFKTAMREIHEAGVRHYDIRPENLMMDDNGRATIIDFDMAKVKAGKRSREREFKHLCYLLNGSYDPPNQWESPPTSASARSPPADDDILYGRI